MLAPDPATPRREADGDARLAGVLHPTDRRLRFLLPGFVLAISTALLLTGCGMFAARTPAPTPADFEGIVANFARRGITVENVVSGDAGCANRSMSARTDT